MVTIWVLVLPEGWPFNGASSMLDSGLRHGGRSFRPSGRGNVSRSRFMSTNAFPIVTAPVSAVAQGFLPECPLHLDHPNLRPAGGQTDAQDAAIIIEANSLLFSC